MGKECKQLLLFDIPETKINYNINLTGVIDYESKENIQNLINWQKKFCLPLFENSNESYTILNWNYEIKYYSGYTVYYDYHEARENMDWDDVERSTEIDIKINDKKIGTIYLLDFEEVNTKEDVMFYFEEIEYNNCIYFIENKQLIRKKTT